MVKRKRSEHPCSHANALNDISQSPPADRPFATLTEAPDSALSSQTSSLYDPDISHLPLTEENLKRVDPDVGSPDSTTSGESKDTTGITAIRDVPTHEVLKRNNYLIDDYSIDDSNGKEVGRDLIRDAKSIVQGGRPSSMKIEIQKYIRELINRYSTTNKLTFLGILWDSLLSQTHGDEMKRDMTEGELWARESYDQKVDHVRNAWVRDSMQTSWKQAFSSDAIPRLETEDRLLQKLLDMTPRVQDSEPDLSYGLKASAFSTIQHDVSKIEETKLGDENYNVFFCIEAEGLEGIQQDMENRCAIAGAAMINLRRKLNYAARENKQTVGPDAESFAFTLMLTPSLGAMFVNWHELRKSPRYPYGLEDAWHMNFLESYDFHDNESFGRLRRGINNVLDWGVGVRKREILEMLDTAAAKKAKYTVDTPAAKQRGKTKGRINASPTTRRGKAKVTANAPPAKPIAKAKGRTPKRQKLRHMTEDESGDNETQASAEATEAGPRTRSRAKKSKQ